MLPRRASPLVFQMGKFDQQEIILFKSIKIVENLRVNLSVSMTAVRAIVPIVSAWNRPTLYTVNSRFQQQVSGVLWGREPQTGRRSLQQPTH